MKSSKFRKYIKGFRYNKEYMPEFGAVATTIRVPGQNLTLGKVNSFVSRLPVNMRLKLWMCMFGEDEITLVFKSSPTLKRTDRFTTSLSVTVGSSFTLTPEVFKDVIVTMYHLPNIEAIEDFSSFAYQTIVSRAVYSGFTMDGRNSPKLTNLLRYIDKDAFTPATMILIDNSSGNHIYRLHSGEGDIVRDKAKEASSWMPGYTPNVWDNVDSFPEEAFLIIKEILGPDSETIKDLVTPNKRSYLRNNFRDQPREEAFTRRGNGGLSVPGGGTCEKVGVMPGVMFDEKSTTKAPKEEKRSLPSANKSKVEEVNILLEDLGKTVRSLVSKLE